ncbi:DUF3093 domain-containing protein [Corynebacterium sp. CNCTC7651]|uniref:DUF3093 domain-containing protein n=1 Tax=Corynebacterium sp. CNCTC7651 TaxID=2815361 RepID=UPI001F420756|nr:DUF3093 domain-containing protein [Corynebacterium sp. CNCTC7651]
MTNLSTSSPGSGSAAPQVLYTERQWVPWYWWAAGLGLVLLLAAQFALNRNIWWFVISFLAVGALVGWFLTWLSKTVLRVELEADGTRWLIVDDANLPNTVVARSMVVPLSARQNALGRQLDPAAFLVSHAWVPEHVLLVLNDPEDPTPYWMISARNPEAVLDAFVPGQRTETSAGE